MKSCLFTLLLSFSLSLYAQQPASYSIQKGDIITESINPKDVYRFDDFQRGTVLFSNGKSATSQLNYNNLYSEMQFITVEGDTLSVVPEPMIEYVSIAEQGFYFHPDFHLYLEVLYESPVLSLTIYRRYQIFDRNKEMINGFVDSDRRFYENMIFEFDNRDLSESLFEFFNRPSKQDLRISFQESYFFVDKNQRIHPATRSNLWKIFPEYRQDLREFVNQHKINFSEGEDLLEMIAYCQQLMEQ